MVVISPVNVEERKDLDLKVGDTVRVWLKIEEKGKTRLQAFEGLVLARKHGAEAGGTFTVRKVASGVGVEKIFPLYSPAIDKIEIVKRAKVRRAKLYYIRDKVAREARRQLRRMRLMNVGTESEQVQSQRAQEEAAAAEAKAAEEAEAQDKQDETAGKEVEENKNETAEVSETVATEETVAEEKDEETESAAKEEDAGGDEAPKKE